MTGWAIQSLVATTVLALAVLALRGTAKRLVGARLAYWLWAVPALRAVLPPLPVSSVATVTDIARSGHILAVGTGAISALPRSSTSIFSLLLALWLGGAALFLVWHVLAYRRFRRRLLAEALLVARSGRVLTFVSPLACSPMAMGVLDPVIVLPDSWEERVGPRASALSIAHERAHHARGDIAANWVALVLLALHWFDPVAWMAFRAFRADQERATDAAVLALHGRDAAEPYARAMLAAAAGPAVSPACHLTTATDLKRRVAMLTNATPSKRRLIAGGTLLTLMASGGLAASAATRAPVGSAATDGPARTLVIETGEDGQRTLLIDGARVASGSALPSGVTLPSGFDRDGSCASVGRQGPTAYVLKGENGERNYTISCTATFGQSGEAASRISRSQAAAALAAARTSIAAQVAVPAAERMRILASIDASIADLR